jgi:DNA-binding SARP family transcriptional activator
LIAPDQVVSVDTMVDTLWQGNPPATGRAQVAICVAGLRKTLQHAGYRQPVIVTSYPGYLLPSAAHRIDAQEHSDLLAWARECASLGQIEEAAGLYERALALWRGPALAGISGEIVETEAARLAQQRLTAYEEYTALKLELGQHEPVIDGLTALVRVEPFREQLRARLMLALYRSGRRAEALEVYQDGRTQFVNELGLEPGPLLRDLHDKILRDTPGLARPRTTLPGDPVVPAQLPGNLPTFTGREAAMTTLDALLDGKPDADSPPVGVITGGAGVGKTALAVHWARRAAARFPDGQLFADLLECDDDAQTAASVVLDRFLRALGYPGSLDEYKFDERVALYRSLLSRRRMLIVLDNARNFAQLQPLLPGDDGCCVLITSRSELEALYGYSAVRVRLDAFTATEAIEVLRKSIGAGRVATDPAGAARLTELCGRLPLALQLAAGRLAAKPHWTVSDMVNRLADEHRRLDELSDGRHSLRTSLQLSYRDLDPLAARLCGLLSLLAATSFATWVGAALLDTGVAVAEDLMEQLVDAHLLEVAARDGTGAVRYRFPGLVRLDAAERINAVPAALRDAALDRALGCWLGLAEQAHARLRGDQAASPGPAPRWALPPAQVDLLLADPSAWSAAERDALIRAVRQAATEGRLDLAWDLAVTTVGMVETQQDIGEWEATCLLALNSARSAGNTRGQAALLYALGQLDVRRRRLGSARSRFARAARLFSAVADQRGCELVLRHLVLLDGGVRSTPDSGVAAINTRPPVP